MADMPEVVSRYDGAISTGASPVRLRVLMASAMLAFSLAAHADVIDQQNTGNGSIGAGNVGQSFTPTLNGINFVTLILQGSGVFSVNLRSGDGFGGALLSTSSSQTLSSSALTSYTFLFPMLVSLTPGSLYTFQGVYSGTAISARESNGDNYTRGQEYAGLGNAQPGFDLAFTEGITTPTVTPEPSSLALLCTGMLGVIGAARRRFTA